MNLYEIFISKCILAFEDGMTSSIRSRLCKKRFGKSDIDDIEPCVFDSNFVLRGFTYRLWSFFKVLWVPNSDLDECTLSSLTFCLMQTSSFC